MEPEPGAEHEPAVKPEPGEPGAEHEPAVEPEPGAEPEPAVEPEPGAEPEPEHDHNNYDISFNIVYFQLFAKMQKLSL